MQDKLCTVLPSAAHAIGGTPCVNLSRIVAHEGLEGTLIVKLECAPLMWHVQASVI